MNTSADQSKRFPISVIAIASAVIVSLFLIFLILPRTLFLRWDHMRVKMLLIEDDAGRARLTLTTLPDGAPSITFNDADGKLRADLSLSELGDPVLSMNSAEGQGGLSVSLLGPERSPQVLLRGKDGSTAWRVFLDANDQPVVIEGAGDGDQVESPQGARED